MRYCYFYLFEIGRIGIVEEDGYIVQVGFDVYYDKIFETELISKCQKELKEYFDKKRFTFSKYYKITGTDFQKSVYLILDTISYGTTCSYDEVAQLVHSRNYARAVGNAVNKNPLLIIIPCHRVIGKNKKLVGYREELNIKKYLLDLEVML